MTQFEEELKKTKTLEEALFLQNSTEEQLSKEEVEKLREKFVKRKYDISPKVCRAFRSENNRKKVKDFEEIRSHAVLSDNDEALATAILWCPKR